MRLRWLVSLLVLPALVFGSAPANAATPGIRSTKEYQALKSYVQVLNSKKSQQQSAAEISKYRSELSMKRAKASAKVRALYQDQLGTAKQRRDNRKAKVVNLKQKRNQQVAQLKQARQARLNAIAADRRAALARINTQYSNKLDTLQKKRTRLQARIARAKNPVKRQNLRDELSAVQDQITTLSSEKQDDIRVANNKYDDQVQQANESYSQRIEQAVEQANRNIANLQQRLRELYQQSKQNAQQRRSNDFALVKDQYAKGVGYINQMPSQNQNP